MPRPLPRGRRRRRVPCRGGSGVGGRAGARVLLEDGASVVGGLGGGDDGSAVCCERSRTQANRASHASGLIWPSSRPRPTVTRKKRLQRWAPRRVTRASMAGRSGAVADAASVFTWTKSPAARASRAATSVRAKVPGTPRRPSWRRASEPSRLSEIAPRRRLARSAREALGVQQRRDCGRPRPASPRADRVGDELHEVRPLEGVAAGEDEVRLRGADGGDPTHADFARAGPITWRRPEAYPRGCCETNQTCFSLVRSTLVTRRSLVARSTLAAASWAAARDPLMTISWASSRRESCTGTSSRPVGGASIRWCGRRRRASPRAMPPSVWMRSPIVSTSSFCWSKCLSKSLWSWMKVAPVTCQWLFL